MLFDFILVSIFSVSFYSFTEYDVWPQLSLLANR